MFAFGNGFQPIVQQCTFVSNTGNLKMRCQCQRKISPRRHNPPKLNKKPAVLYFVEFLCHYCNPLNYMNVASSFILLSPSKSLSFLLCAFQCTSLLLPRDSTAFVLSFLSRKWRFHLYNNFIILVKLNLNYPKNVTVPYAYFNYILVPFRVNLLLKKSARCCHSCPDFAPNSTLNKN